MPDPLISLITPTHNRLDLLKETAASVRGQVFKDFEHIIIDDASEDGTWTWLQDAAAGDPKLRIIRADENIERTRARNLGLEKARGKFVLFLDDDDLLPANALADHVKAFESHPEISASVGGFVYRYPDREQPAAFNVPEEWVQDPWQALVFGWAFVPGQALIRTERLRAIGGWDTAYHRFAEDYATYFELLRGQKVALLPEITLRYRVHAGQTQPANAREIMFEILDREIAGLPEGRKALAKKIRLARVRRVRAQDLRAIGNRLGALMFELGAVLAAPGILKDPLVRLQWGKVWRSLSRTMP